MIQPKIPVSLTVIISIVATITDTMQEVIGPQISPPKVTITSDGSYFKNNTTGILPTAMITYVIAHSIPIVVIFLVLLFI